MKCWHCKTELIWGADHDLEDNDEFIMVTNLSCPNCGSYVEVYYPKQKPKRKENIYEFKKNSTRKKP